MKIASISVATWSTGQVMVQLDNNDSVHINLTEDESERFRQLASDIFFARQKSIAKEIETARPLMIELQPERVEETPAFDDDVPF
jgi:hypothetical protein